MTNGKTQAKPFVDRAPPEIGCLSDLILQAKQDGHPISLCKEVAKSSPEWKVHIEGESVALGNRSRKRARYENLRILWEARRTLEVTTRSLSR